MTLAGGLAGGVITVGTVIGATAPTLAAATPPPTTPVAQAAEAPPGTLRASSPMPRELWLDGAADATRIRYSTVGPHGPTPATGVVYLPPGPTPGGGWPVIAWAHGTVGDSDSDAPSVVGEHPETAPYTAGWLQRGYAVVASDYIGMGTLGIPPYLDGDAAAHAVIDSVRAAHQVTDALSDSWAVVGLSQGGQAAMFTASIADAYAPELDFRGTAAIGVPSNIETLAPLGGPWFPPAGMFSGLTNFMSFTIAGLRDVRADLDIDSYLTPLGERLVNAAPRLPYSEFHTLSDGVSVSQMLSRSLNDPVLIDALRDYLAIPLTGYREPILLVQGAADTVVPIPLTLKLVTDLNLAGVHPDFQVVPGGHIQSIYDSEAQAADFVAGLFR
ncbi:lipase family protein [Tomitella gaofuii]|uniref:lipase family protein n=1 Tax=Tomitella gaofuii TaxID=2760083 RepID=UPI0015FD3BE0|nr:lipase family protein [Tomitella gaofuii]